MGAWRVFFIFAEVFDDRWVMGMMIGICAGEERRDSFRWIIGGVCGLWFFCCVGGGVGGRGGGRKELVVVFLFFWGGERGRWGMVGLGKRRGKWNGRGERECVCIYILEIVGFYMCLGLGLGWKVTWINRYVAKKKNSSAPFSHLHLQPSPPSFPTPSLSKKKNQKPWPIYVSLQQYPSNS